MTWDGLTERRRNGIIDYDKFLNMCEGIARTEAKVEALDKRINGSLEAVQNHINHGAKWRMTIVGVAISLAMSVIGAVYGYGKLVQAVETHIANDKPCIECKGETK